MASEVGTKGRFDRALELAAEALGGSIGWLAARGVLFVVFTLLWVGVGVAMVTAPGGLTEAWRTIGDQGVLVQGVLWLLFLPVMAGLWVWHADWPELLRLAIIGALGAWTILVFRPRRGPIPAAQ